MDKKYKKFEQQIICPKCFETTKTVIKNITRSMVLKKEGTVCNSCKIISSNKRSLYMKNKNPMFNEDVKIKVKNTIKKLWNNNDYKEKMIERLRIGAKKRIGKYSLPPEKKLEFSERMKKKNPMKNLEIRKKVQETCSKKDYSTWPKGPDHWLWKGNRNKFQVIRTRLYPVWTFPILERDKFQCQYINCQEKTNLEVHHLTNSFNDIVLNNLNGRNINDLNDLEFENLINQVLNDHSNVEGITLCKSCHKKIHRKEIQL